jgi:F0F1-type ATP synthase assembly protein I
MVSQKHNKPESNDKSLMRYMGLASQFFISIGIFLAIGWKLDKLFHFSAPFLIWVLPLLIIIASLIKLIKDTSIKK